MNHTLRTPIVRTLAVATLALGLAGCGAMQAQNPSGALQPVNAVEIPPDQRVLLKGADVVAYFTDGKYVQGQPAFKSVHEGVTLHFASAEHKAAFDQAPQKYLPQFGGYCANGIVYGIPWGGDADTWKIIDGKLYIFGGRGSQDAFELDPPATWPWRRNTGPTRSRAATASSSAPSGWCSRCRTTRPVKNWPRRWPRPRRPSPDGRLAAAPLARRRARAARGCRGVRFQLPRRP
jgi:YHS domain-containing protein